MLAAEKSEPKIDIRIGRCLIKLFSTLRRREPARDLKFAAHHRRIVTVDREVHIFKDDESIGLLHVVEKMDERRPGALRFDRSEYGLMIRSRLTRADRRVLDQNIVF